MARTVPHNVTLESMQNIVLLGNSRWTPINVTLCGTVLAILNFQAAQYIA
jgi:hypothetical protein